jgi:hypothetical protein
LRILVEEKGAREYGTAAQGLRRFGTNAQQAIPALTLLLNNPKKSVDYCARLAIKQITLEAER